jgi:UMP-CMP kinase
MVTTFLFPVTTCITFNPSFLLFKATGNNKFLIDGFPRNKDNLEGWQRQMSEKVDFLFVLFFECSSDKCVERCLKRGQAGSGRTDDNLESLNKRFNTYMNDTMPIIDHYRALGKVRQIDANESPDAVYQDVDAALSEAQGQKLF